MIQIDLYHLKHLYELQDGMTALAVAARSKHPDVVKILSESDVVLHKQLKVGICFNF